MENGTPNAGETSTPEAPKNDTRVSDSSEVEKLRAELKEAQQKAMRVNQVENELARLREAEEKRRQAELEEQNQYKELFEQEKARREAIEKEREAEEQRKKLEKARAEVLADFSDEVKELAEEAGLTLTSADEDARKALREKLERIQQKLGVNGRVTPNNPNTSTVGASQEELLKRVKNGDRNARMQAISNLEAVKAMKALAGYYNK